MHVVVNDVDDVRAFNTEEEDREDLHFKDVKDVWDKAMVFIMVYDSSFVFVSLLLWGKSIFDDEALQFTTIHKNVFFYSSVSVQVSK